MSVLPVPLESEILDGLQNTLNASENDPVYTGSHELPDHNSKLAYRFVYYNYHRMGKVQHGVEVTFRLQDTKNLVSSDINSIEKSLTNILQSTLSFDGCVKLEYENSEYVFTEEIVHSFGERT